MSGFGHYARTADELAGFFRAAAYTLTDVRLGEAVPPIKVDRVVSISFNAGMDSWEA